jgi:hypothetical protein
LRTQQEDGAGGIFDSTVRTVAATGEIQLDGFETGLSTTTGQEASGEFMCTLNPGDVLHHLYVAEEVTAD